jgi:hypothetical protein
VLALPYLGKAHCEHMPSAFHSCDRPHVNLHLFLTYYGENLSILFAKLFYLIYLILTSSASLLLSAPCGSARTWPPGAGLEADTKSLSPLFAAGLIVQHVVFVSLGFALNSIDPWTFNYL